MARAVWLLPALLLASCETVPITEDSVQLTVLGPPIAAEETGQKFIYQRPRVPEGMPDDASTAGLRAQGWSMLGREDRGAALGGGLSTGRRLAIRCQHRRRVWMRLPTT